MSFSTDLADDTKLEAAAAELWATVAMLFTNETVLASSTICDPNEAALEALRNCSSAVDCVALADLMALAAELYKLSAELNKSFADDTLPAAAYDSPADNADDAKAISLLAFDK